MRNIIIGLLWITLGALAFANPMVAEDPDYSDVDDMLDGKRQISLVDDLIAVNPRKGDYSGTLLAENLLHATSDSEITSEVAEGSEYWFQPEDCSLDPFPQQTRTARLFPTINDSVVTLFPSASGNGASCNTSKTYAQVFDYESKGKKNSFRDPDIPHSSRWPQMAIADFDFDGFDEIFVIDDVDAYVLSDPNVSQQSWTVNPSVATGASRTAVADPVVGDFNNDGIYDVSWVGGNVLGNSGSLAVYTASVCPGSVSDTLCAGKQPLSLVLSSHSIPVDAHFGNNCHPTSALMGGDFAGTGYDQLMVAYTRHDSQCKVDVYYYEANTQLEWSEISHKSDLINGGGNQSLITLYGQGAPINWFGSTDQAVLGVGVEKNGDYEVRLYIFACDNGKCNDQLNWTSDEVQSNHRILYGLAVGRFNDASDDAADFDLQVAYLTQYGGESEGQIFINDLECTDENTGDTCSADPSDPTFTVGEQKDAYTMNDWRKMDSASHDRQAFIGSHLRAGDLQGRSVRVGNPIITRVAGHSQPDMVLAMPPMHADFVQGYQQSSAEVVNISALPTSFTATYAVEGSQSSQSSNRSTTSYSTSTAETVGGEVKFGMPLVGGVDVTTTNTWQQAHAHSVSESLDEYSSQSFNASTTTKTSGQLWYTVSRLNIYQYPVYGQTVCTEDEGQNCSDPKPLYLTLSGPDQIQRKTVAANVVEWFQPFSEPYQIFSYAPTLDQLENRIGDVSTLSDTSLTFVTDNNEETFSVTWSEGSSQEETTGSETTHSFDSKTSMTVGTPNLDSASSGVNVNAGFDYSSSNSISTLVSSTLSLAESSGVSIEVPGTFRNPGEYAYPVTPLIFGQPNPDGTYQTDAQSDVESDIATTGVLQTRYLADPTDEQGGAGAWWSSSTNPYTQSIDVALNHPVRWSVADTGDLDALECLVTSYGSGSFDCVRFIAPDPDDLWGSEFYWMRGLSIQIGSAEGPQRDTAVAGDTVYLTARIYNYSLASMADGTQVKVRFYRQPWNADNTANGDSVLIDEMTVGDSTIPPFGDDAGNWTTASASFDTTDLADTYQLFWVLVWAEKDGQLVSELSGHGLSALPGDLTSIDQVPLEQVTYEQNGETVTATFSNNVGYYHKDFYIAPAGSQLADEGEVMLAVEDLVAVPTTQDDRKMMVAARIVAEGGPASGVLVSFDATGDDADNRVFDVEYLARIRADEPREARVPWRPLECGAHVLSVTAEAGGIAPASATITVDVPCD